jgi:hypothetical protein
MNEEEDILIEFFRERLTDHRYIPGAGVFASLEEKVFPRKSKRIGLYALLSGVAALFLLFLLLNSELFLLEEKGAKIEIVSEEKRISNDFQTNPPLSEPETKASEETALQMFASKRVQADASDILTDRPGLPLQNEVEFDFSQKKEETIEVKPFEKNEQWTFELPANEPALIPKKNISKKWQVALASNALLLVNNYNTPADVQSNSRLRSHTNHMNIGSVSNNSLVSDDKLTAIDYAVPFNLSLILSKNLSPRWSLETGLSYNCLRSEEEWYAELYQTYQTNRLRLHYVGIPLRFRYKFLRSDAFSVYASSGGMIEKVVWADITSVTHYGLALTGKLDIPQLQYSVNADLGVEYRFLKSIGVFFEPGLVYYFDDGNKTETIRKDKPFNYSLRGGLRLSF